MPWVASLFRQNKFIIKIIFMNIKNLAEEKPLSPNPWGSLEKTATDNQEMPEVLNDAGEDEDIENKTGEINLKDLDKDPENPYEETEGDDEEMEDKESTEEIIDDKELKKIDDDK